MLDNDTVEIHQIKDIKDDLEYYIENCRDPDFMENDMLYEDIDGLEEMLLDVGLNFLFIYFLSFLMFKNLVNLTSLTTFKDSFTRFSK
jgi:hypothetical protein